VTTYRARSEGASLDFGKPEPLFQGSTGARTYTAAGCPPQGCSRAIRIDPSVDEDRLYYVYFGDGTNSIASVALSNPLDIRLHTKPVNAYEEKINEAPELLAFNGRRYMFFSGGFFNSQYATFYLMGNTSADLTRANGPVHRLTTPVRRKNGKLVETHGHNAVAVRRGEAFNFFHIGVFDAAGNLTRRDTWMQRLMFNPDGTAISQNEIRVSWNGLGPGHVYSLDIQRQDGTFIGPCISAGTIGAQTSATFTGICPDAGDLLVHKAEVIGLRLYASKNGGPFQRVGDVAYDGYSDVINLAAQ
jgi:hypothetical protein